MNSINCIALVLTNQKPTLLEYDTKDERFEAPLETQSFKYQTQGCRKKKKISKRCVLRYNILYEQPPV